MYTVGAVALIFLVCSFIGFKMISDNEAARQKVQKDIAEKPEVYTPASLIDKSLVDPTLHHVSGEHFVGDFSFTDQNGMTVNQSVTEGKIYVADYFFTTCGGICPAMTKQMERVQAAFVDNPDVVILSHTVWPERDSVPVMKAYAEEHGAVDGKWFFLTGEKDDLYSLARKSYFVLKPAAVKGKGDGESDFIHTNQFVLVDKNRRIRGYYKGTEFAEVSRLIKDMEYLLEN
jgi:protein SCO1/2